MSNEERLMFLELKNEQKKFKDEQKVYKNTLYAIQNSQVKFESRIAQLEVQLNLIRELGIGF